jgi:hypothetical protein
MSVSDWIVALFSLTSGAGIVGFWVQRLAAQRVKLEEHVMRLHLAALRSSPVASRRSSTRARRGRC